MAEVIIHRCTLRVVRRRGWSWGGDTRRLVRAATSALPALIERKLAELFKDDADLDIAAPVVLRVPVSLAELLALARAPATTGAHTETTAERIVGARLARAVEDALPAGFRAATEGSDDSNAPPDERARLAAVVEEDLEETVEGSLLRLMLAWHGRGELDVHLAALAAPALELWLRALRQKPPPPNATNIPPDAIRQAVGELWRALRPRVRDHASLLRARIVAAVEVYTRLQVAPSDVTLVRALEDQFTAPAAAPVNDSGEVGDDLPHPAQSERAHRRTQRPEEAATPTAAARLPPRVAEAVRPELGTEVTVASALPFLLLGPLVGVGYWETLAGALEAAGLEAESHLFAAAFAYKVLAPPARGWRRTPADDACAAAFAHLAEPPQGSELAEFARKVSMHLAPLDSVVTHALVRGHKPGSPVLLHRAAHLPESRELVLFDTDGLFAIACADDWPALLPAARHFLEDTLLVGVESADASLLGALAASGFKFVTDAPPARGENWRELRRTIDERWYTNSRDAREAALVKQAQQLGRSSEEATLLWRALAAERAGLVPARAPRFERSLALAAALGLGVVSWALWREREFSTPLLALERFSDLAARVRFTERHVQVRLPLGRRRSDLEEKGMLADVRGVPWLGRRIVQFSGG